MPVLSETFSLAGCVALDWVILVLLVVLDFEPANASMIVPGLNATVIPNIELYLIKRRRDSSFSCFIPCSLCLVLDLGCVAIISSIPSIQGEYLVKTKSRSVIA